MYRKPADAAAGGVDLALPAAARLADAAAPGRGVNGRRAAAIAAVAGGGDEGLTALLLTLTGGLTLARPAWFLALSYQHRLAAAGPAAGGAAG